VPDDQGMIVVRGRLDPKVASVLPRAPKAAEDTLFNGGRREQLEELEAERKVSARPMSGFSPA
jgi:hypothetical protein